MGLAFAIAALLALLLSTKATVRGDHIALLIGGAGLAICAFAIWFETKLGLLRPLFDLSALFPLAIGLLFTVRRVASPATGAVPLFFITAALVLVPLGFVLTAGYLVKGHG